MSAPRRGSLRWIAVTLASACLSMGFEASAYQVAQPNNERSRTYRSTEGNDPVEAQLDGSTADPTGGIPTDVPNQGLVYAGLKRIDKKTSRCRGAYGGRGGGGKRICTHGPDAAPRGVDVRRRRSTKELRATTTATATTARGEGLPCYDDGTSGPRVQAIYARTSDNPDRSSAVLPLIPQWAATVDAVFDQSAIQTGGRRHVRWVTSATCALQIESVTLSAAADDSLTNTITELQALGYNRTDRKYLVWMDATRYCGIAEIKGDDQPGPANAHNFGPMFGRVDTACWGTAHSTEAHELMHMLGGIQLSAPHSSGGWHCTDENDRMCLPELGKSLSYSCAEANEALFDCGHDDYFNTAPAPASYLATHWNAANNVFLSSEAPDACWTTTQVDESAETKKKRRHRRRHRRGGARPPAAPTGPVPAGPCANL